MRSIDRFGSDDRLVTQRSPLACPLVAAVMAVAAMTAGGVLGCKGGGSQQPVAAGDADPGLQDLKDFLTAAKVAGRKTTRAEALPVIQAQHMAADYYLGKGDIVFQWGASLSDAPDAGKRIVAFQKVAEKEGGWALFQDGSLRKVTATEFAAAPKVE